MKFKKNEIRTLWTYNSIILLVKFSSSYTLQGFL